MMQKLHHEKSRGTWMTPMGMMTRVDYWCGMHGYTEVQNLETLLDPIDKVHLANPDNHCKNCLIKKRQAKGDAYMLEHGYPLVERAKKRKTLEEPRGI